MKLILGLVICAFFVLLPEANCEKNVICYFASWTVYRPGHGKYDINDIDVSLCTHLYFSFIGLNTDGTVNIIDPWYSNDDGLRGFHRFMALRDRKPSLKLLISMGGWNEGSAKYSAVAADPTLRKVMVNDVVAFVNKWDFDGFDLDWEYPGNREGSQPEIDKDDFTLLIQELKAALHADGKILTAAVSGSTEKALVGYDIPKVSEALDFINVMAYDYHGAFEGYVGHISPLYASSLDTGLNRTLNTASGIQVWLENGADPAKVCLGIPMYGRSFTLADVNQTGLYAPIIGGGREGPYSRQSGFLDYKEVCELHSDWTYVWDDEQKVPHRVSGNQWVGYEDEKSVKEKVKFAKSKKLAGIMVWALDSDDFNGLCGEKYPLIRTIHDNL